MIFLMLCTNKECRHEWETSNPEHIICNWCGKVAGIIDRRDSIFTKWDSQVNEKKVTKRHGK